MLHKFFTLFYLIKIFKCSYLSPSIYLSITFSASDLICIIFIYKKLKMFLKNSNIILCQNSLDISTNTQQHPPPPPPPHTHTPFSRQVFHLIQNTSFVLRPKTNSVKKLRNRNDERCFGCETEVITGRSRGHGTPARVRLATLPLICDKTRQKKRQYRE